MNVVVTCDHHFERSPDGAIWAHGPLTRSFWERYRPVFDKVRLVARVRDVPEAPEGEQPANGDGIEFIPVPNFTGPAEYLLRKRAVAAAVRGAITNGDAVMLRAPSVVGDCLVPDLRRSGRPFGVEVIADPYDSFGSNAVQHPLRLFFRWLFSRNLRGQCAVACGAAYVTERALQRRYPPRSDAFATHYSSIDLPNSSFVSAPRTTPLRRPARLLLVGTLAQLYKGPDVLIDAVAELVRDGLELELSIVGGGQHLREMEARAASHGIGGLVHFTGNLTTSQAVRAELDRADLFTLPSRQEGLPRAMIEAMARGLPAIGSTVGGIPELLPADDLVPPNDARALAAKIREVLGDPERMALASARNLAKAHEYSQEVLTPRRQALYAHVRTRTEEWLRGQGAR
jgi:glycosyltransferase involved in cell wall biosynthesis